MVEMETSTMKKKHTRLRNYTIELLTTSSSRVLVNGIPYVPINHGHGLGNDDTSHHCCLPSLFILSIAS